MKLSIVVLSFLIPFTSLNAQTPDSVRTRPYETLAHDIFTTGLGSGKAYTMLNDLVTNVGARLSGSENAFKAIAWGKAKMIELGFDSVYTEPVMVPHWVRGKVEKAEVINSSKGKIPLTICALGGTIGTPKKGIIGEVIEVQNFDELHALGEKVKGKIVFYNRPMDRTKFTTGEAYGGAVNQRGSGAIEAARLGGIGSITRTMTTRIDDVPHTGAMRYNDSIPKVPATAISTLDADMLSDLLKKEPHCKIHLTLSAEVLPDVEQANVIGEIHGTEKPEEVIVMGGHLDSWDKGRGAHDDGAGCVHSIEALRLLKQMGLHPKRTIRVVLFINEENGTKGGIAYAAKDRPGQKHIAAIESDAGGFMPRGFGVSADSAIYEKIKSWEYLFEPIEADRIRKGGGGTDVGELGKNHVVTIGLRVDGQKYFDYHHSDLDTMDKVNERELEYGAAMMAILSYVMAQEGL